MGAEKTVSIGDEVSIFDGQDGSRPEDMSAACGASVYDLIFTGLPSPVGRVSGVPHSP